MTTNRRLLLYSGDLSHVRWWPLEKCLLQAVVVDTVVLLKSWPQAQSIILWLMSICYPQPWVTIHICSVKEICTEGHLFCFVFFIKHHLKTLTVSQMCPSATPTVTHWNSILYFASSLFKKNNIFFCGWVIHYYVTSGFWCTVVICGWTWSTLIGCGDIRCGFLLLSLTCSRFDALHDQRCSSADPDC